MSVIDNLRVRAKPAPAMQAPDIAARLEAARTDLAALEQKIGNAALDALAQGTDLTSLQRELTAARERAAMLDAAHKAALARDEAEVVRQRAALQKTQLAAVRKHIEARDAAADDLSAAIGEAVKHYHTLLDRSAKAQAACPIGMIWPNSGLCEPDPIRKLVRYELSRASNNPGNRNARTFPGAELPGMEFDFQPAAIPSMTEQIKKASGYVIGTLTGKAAD